MGGEAAPAASAWRRRLWSGWAEFQNVVTTRQRDAAGCSIGSAPRLRSRVTLSILVIAGPSLLPNQLDDDVEEDGHQRVGYDQDDSEIHGCSLSVPVSRSRSPLMQKI
jgi:hypothetical protein